ncbi:2-phospho-L-lactate guanylyltransferase [Microbacterium sp. G2-8]|uniref:2-phospho-L-lactate guanylyltransferase n=1 Tax=Microbacterium sp. G2-8 TaxID=2842454 RepID=UPI001C8A5BB5|nr:2-phospho-L-lactate guanylyltransferase [Microbacterium sp. G2-8]
MKWSVVIPVKTTAAGKSRLDLPGTDRPRLALAIALDTIDAAAKAAHVDEVIAVTSDADVQAGVDLIPSARWIADPGMGLNGAVRAGLERAEQAPRAAMLGDLPALTSADLDAALDAAAHHERAFVRDEEGHGSTLVTWRTPVTFESHFGADSAHHHSEAGHEPLDLVAATSLRRDVDTYEQLTAAAELGLGPRTTALLKASRQRTADEEDPTAA